MPPRDGTPVDYDPFEDVSAAAAGRPVAFDPFESITHPNIFESPDDEMAMGPDGPLPAPVLVDPPGRPRIENPDGTVSSELSITVPDPRSPGHWINIPSMYEGREVPQADALARIGAAGYRDPETGREIQSYASMEEAEAAARARSAGLGRPETTVLGELGEVSGVPAGFVKAGGSTMQGVSAAFPAVREDLPEERRAALRERMREAEEALLAGDVETYTRLTRAIHAEAFVPVAQRGLWQAGERVREFAERAFPAKPGYEDSLGRAVYEGLGSFGAGLAAGAVHPGAALVLFTTMGMGEAADRADAALAEQHGRAAVDSGAYDEQIARAALLGVGPGMTDQIPVEILLGRLPVPGMRAVGQAVRSFGGEKVLLALGRIGTQGAVEAVQEGGQQALQNLIARHVHSPDTEIWGDVPKSAGVGGIVGTVAGLGREGVLALAARRSRSRSGERAAAVDSVPGPSAEDEASPIATADIVEGRERVADAMATENLNRNLAAGGLPTVGTPVRISRPHAPPLEGVVTDGWTGEIPGLTISALDGTPLMDASLAELQATGATIEVLAMPPGEGETEADARPPEIAAQDRHMGEIAAQARADVETTAGTGADTGGWAPPAGMPTLTPRQADAIPELMRGGMDADRAVAVAAAMEPGDVETTAPVETAEAGRVPAPARTAPAAPASGETAPDRPRIAPGALPEGDVETTAPMETEEGADAGVQARGAPAGVVERAGEAEPVAPAEQPRRPQVRPGAAALEPGDVETTGGVEADTGGWRPPGDIRADIARAEGETNTAPTEGQKEAGNYAKGRVRLRPGMEIVVENPKGSERSGRGKDGEPWSVTMPATYGYVARTEGADGDQVDVYLGPEPESDRVFVVDQVDADTKAFDEHKAMLGYSSEEAAIADYDAAFDDGRGPERRGAVTATTMEDFRDWLADGDTAQPLGELESEPAALPGASRAAPQVVRAGGEGRGEPSPAPPQPARSDLVLRMDGKPFRTEKSAELAADMREMADDYRIVPVPGGFGIRVTPTAPTPAPSLRRRRRGPVDALRYIAEQGGIREVEGDLAAMGADTKFIPGAGRLTRKGGRSPDEVALMLYEAGYFPGATERPTVADVYDLIAEGIAGRPTWRAEDAAEVERIEAERGRVEQSDALDRARQDIDAIAEDWSMMVPAATREELAVAVTAGQNAEELLVDYIEREALAYDADPNEAEPGTPDEAGGEGPPGFAEAGGDARPEALRRGAGRGPGRDRALPAPDGAEIGGVPARPGQAGERRLAGARRLQQQPPGGVRVTPTRAFDAERAALAREFEEIGRRMFGAGFEARFADRIVTREGGRPTGAYDTVNRIAWIALRDPKEMTGTLYHEGLHHLRGAGAFSRADGRPTAAWRTLEAAAPEWRERFDIDARYEPGTPEDVLNEEAIAEAIDDFAKNGPGEASGPVRLAIRKVLNFFARIRNALHGRGFRTANDVFEGVRAGDFAGRTGRRDPAALDSYLQRAWHSSPYTFEEFSTDYVGTGEGSQAFGWGLYFGGARAVGEFYQEKFRQRMARSPAVAVNRKPYGDMRTDPRAVIDALEELGVGPEDAAAIDGLMNKEGDFAGEVLSAANRHARSVREAELRRRFGADFDRTLDDFDRLAIRSDGVEAMNERLTAKLDAGPQAFAKALDAELRALGLSAANRREVLALDRWKDPAEIRREAGPATVAFNWIAQDAVNERFHRMREAVEQEPAVEEADRIADVIGNADFSPRPPLYRVDLQPEEDEYLLWDEPVADQSAKVRAALREFWIDDEQITGGEAYQELAFLARADAPGTDGQRAASLALLDRGVRGIKFLDRGSRGLSDAAAAPTYNFVIFDDSDIDIDEVRFQQAWHSSPNLFEEFSTEHIGEGEGSNAFGWGLYFGEARTVGDFYRELFEGRIGLTNEQLREYYTPGRIIWHADGAADRVIAFHEDTTDPDWPRWSVTVESVRKNAAGEWEARPFPGTAMTRRTHSSMPSNQVYEAATGKKVRPPLYRSNLLPREDEYLLWDRPLRDQPRKVRDYATWLLEERPAEIVDRVAGLPNPRGGHVTVGERLAFPGGWLLVTRSSDDAKPVSMAWKVQDATDPAEWNDVTVARAKQEIPRRARPRGSERHLTGEELYWLASRALGGKREASLSLLDRGVRGNKYLDKMSRPVRGPLGRGWVPPQQTYNYVIFDAADIEIDEVLLQRGRNPGDAVAEQFNLTGADRLTARDAVLWTDALAGIAEAIGVPDAAMGLGRTVGLRALPPDDADRKVRTIGRYFPATREIGVGRWHGVQVAAHEWFHALDHHFGTRSLASGQRPAPVPGAAARPAMMTELAYEPNIGKRIRPATKKAWTDLVQELRDLQTYARRVKQLTDEADTPDWAALDSEYELLARAFEQFVNDKLGLADEAFSPKLYPNAREQIGLRRAFNNLFQTMRVADTKRGPVLFQERRRLGAFDTEPGAEGVDQAVIPGAERQTRDPNKARAARERAELAMRGRKRPTVPQEDADIGLFAGEEEDQGTLFQYPTADDPDEFDRAASGWAGVDLSGIAGEIRNDQQHMGGFGEEIAAQFLGPEAVRAPNVVVEDTIDQKDLNVAMRLAAPPPLWAKKFPEVQKVVDGGLDAELNESIWYQRLIRQWEGITRDLSQTEFVDLTGLIFLGDAEQREFADNEITQFDTSPKVRAAYKKVRPFLDKLGRFTEQHNRAMALNLLTRRTKLVRKMAAERGVVPGAFRKIYDQRAALLAQQRGGRGDPVRLEEDIAIATEQLRGKGARSPEFDAWLAEADRIQPRIDDTRVRRRKGYVPHKFFGRWRISKEVDPEGAAVKLGFGDKPYPSKRSAERAATKEGGGIVVQVGPGQWGFRSKWTEIADESGVWATRTEAIRAASKLAKDDPDSTYRVSVQQFVYPEDQATQLSDAGYGRFVDNVNRLLGLEGEELREAVKGAARRRFRRRIPGFSLYRTGMEGYSRDLDRVMRAHIGDTVRYIALDRLKFDAINMMEREGLSESRSAVQDRPVLAAAVNQWFKDVNGEKQRLESQVDSLFEKSWVTPLRAGLAAGGLAFLASGGPMNAPISPIVGAYVGWRVGRAVGQGGSFASRSLTGGMLHDMSHLKLGMFLNLMSAAVNTTQTVLNTLPALGPRDTAVGIKRLEKAVRSYMGGKPNSDWRQLERHDIRPLHTFAEGTRHQFMKEARVKKISMFFFTTAETANRGIAFLGGLNKAQRQGMSPGAASKYAARVMTRTQFHYGSAHKPELLRNVFLRVPGQFKNFVAQQLAFMLGLNRRELPMFLLSMTMVAGALGIPGLDLIDELAQWLFDGFSPILELKKRALEGLAEGELVGGMWTFITRGLPGLLGTDISGRVGMGDKFLPLQLRDWKGAWLSTIENAVRHGREGARIEDQVRNLSPGLGNPLKALESFRDGGTVTSPWKRDRPEYTATARELALKATGARPIREARLQDMRDIERVEREDARAGARRYIDRIVDAILAGDDAEVDAIYAEAEAAGVRIPRGSVRRALRDMGSERADREVRSLPPDLRERGYRWRDAIEREARP